jgi:hypothetical protein
MAREDCKHQPCADGVVFVLSGFHSHASANEHEEHE